MKRSALLLLSTIVLATAGCDSISGLFSGDEEVVTPAPSSEAAETRTEAAAPAADDKALTPGDWRVLVILDTSADNSFFAPEQALAKTLENTKIKLMHHNSTDPIEVKNASGETVGTITVTTLTDQKAGYIFAEEGRPANFLANASLPFVLQQASSYFNEQIRMGNGQRASGGLSGFGKGKGGKAGAGKPMPAEMKARAREQKGDTVRTPLKPRPMGSGGPASEGAKGAEGATSGE